MPTYNFSSLSANQHILFDPLQDILSFDDVTISASAVQITAGGVDLGFTYGGKTVWLDGMPLAAVSFANVTFMNNSVLAIGDGTPSTSLDWYGAEYPFATSTVGNQVWGLGGADLVATGSGADFLVGNVAAESLVHVSRVGGLGAPTSSFNPTISADGRFVGFEGGWTGFGSVNNSATDVFVKDVTTGAISDEHRSSGGTSGNSGSGAPVISADGSVLAFLSRSSNLVPGAGSNALYDIYVSEVGGSGIVRVSTGNGGVLAVDGSSINPDLSADGRYVVFESTTTNWAATAANTTSDIFLKDRLTDTLERLSTSLTGGDGNDASRFAKISADGRFVVFESAATNLIGTDTNGQTDIYIWDRDFGSLTNLSSLDPVGTRNPNNASNLPDVAYDNGWGGVVVFQTAKALVAADIFNGVDVYAFNLLDGSFQLVSSKADGSAVQLSSGDASVSGDGRFVVFSSVSDELVPGDTNGTRDVFVKDLFTGQIALVSSSAAGVQGNQSSGNPEISLGGEWIVFESSASNLAGTDANGTFNDVFRVANPLLLDTLIGGAGDDIYVLARADVVQEQVNGGIDTIQSSISYSLADTDGAGALGGNVENLMLTGSANLDATGNALNNVLTGNSGDNVLNGDSGSDTASYVSATAGVTVNLTVLTPQNTVGAGTDTLISIENLIGSNLNDVLTGGSGNNVLDGGPGNDSFTGGAGDDTYITDSSADVITSESTVAGGGGIDTVVAGVNWTLQAFLENLVLTGTSNLNGGGNSGNNLIVGNAGNNVLNGFSGDDTLDGGPGNDSLTGGQGDDTYITDSSADVITSESSVSGGAGIDTVRAGVNWTLQAFLENLVLTGTGNLNGGGNSGNNLVTGNVGNNVLNGFSGDDTIDGAAGDDAIISGSGNNMITGGAGNDSLDGTFGFDTAMYSGLPAAYTINRNGLTTTISGPDGNDTLTSIERLQFGDLSVRNLEHAERDFGNDGKSDILWRNDNGNVLSWNMNGTAIASSPLLAGVPTDWKIAEGSGDYNGDGSSDILWRNDNGSVLAWQMNGSAILDSQFVASVTAEWKIADGAGDYNGDGKSDVLWRNDNGNVLAWLMDGGTIASSAFIAAVPADWKIADGSGDYNGDGKSDVLWRNDNGNVLVWLMNDTTISSSLFVASVPTDWKIADGSGDYNGDGKSDILWRNDNGNVLQWQMNGGAIVSSPAVASVPIDWKIADGSSDYNGDGKSDVLWRNDNGTVLAWTMDGAAITSAAPVASVTADWQIQA